MPLTSGQPIPAISSILPPTKLISIQRIGLKEVLQSSVLIIEFFFQVRKTYYSPLIFPDYVIDLNPLRMPNTNLRHTSQEQVTNLDGSMDILSLRSDA